MRILPEYCIGLVIDYQEKLAPHMFDGDQVSKNVEVLIQGLQVLEIPLIVTQQYTNGLGRTIPSIENYLKDIDKIEKISFSCCGEDKFVQNLKKSGRKIVIISGIEAHVCVLQTTIDLVNTGYQPVVVDDCISSRKINDKQIALKRMIEEGAIITTFESILFELCQIAGNEKFKAISKLVK